MREIIIIRTDESRKLKNLLDREKVNYEIYQEQKKHEETSEKEKLTLGEAYQRAYKNNPHLLEVSRI